MNMNNFNQFQGSVKTEKIRYIADPNLRNIVNVSIALGRPLLVRGEPGNRF
jgi:MoxR-like ATPase